MPWEMKVIGHRRTGDEQICSFGRDRINLRSTVLDHHSLRIMVHVDHLGGEDS